MQRQGTGFLTEGGYPMIVFKLFPAFMLFLLLAGNSLIMPGQAYAKWCCPCGTECSWLNIGSWFCECRGKSPECPYCQNKDAALQAKSLDENGIPDIGSVLASVPAAPADLTASVTERMRGGQCATNKYTQHLLASAGELLRFQLAFIQEQSAREQSLAFNTTFEK